MTTARAPVLDSPSPARELRDADRVVGWIEGDVVRFSGFASETGAAQAAAVAHQAMLRRLARGSRGTPPENEFHRTAVRRTSEQKDAPSDGRSVASVLRYVRDADVGDFAFELRVPPPVDELRMRGMAYVMYRALRSSGVDWPLLRPTTAPDGAAAASSQGVARANASARESPPASVRGIQRNLERASRPWAGQWSRPQHAG